MGVWMNTDEPAAGASHGRDLIVGTLLLVGGGVLVFIFLGEGLDAADRLFVIVGILLLAGGQRTLPYSFRRPD